jgi:Icc-related predicted phosphoesterase
MRLVMLSDTHSFHEQITVPEGDVLIHAGDLTMRGKLREFQDVAEWLDKLPHKHKLVIGGNHDWCLEAFMKEGREDVVQDILNSSFYLRDSSINIDGINFHGSPWTPEFCGWAFNLERGKELRDKWDMISPSTDVLITHGPPAGMMDYVWPHGKYTRTKGGCDDLLDAVCNVQPRVHVFGHIHGGYSHVYNGHTHFFNASIVNERYRVVNEPWVLDLEER